MRVLFIGDVMAEPGLRAVGLHLPDIRDRYDLVIANGENAAAGFGLTREIGDELFDLGIDFVFSICLIISIRNLKIRYVIFCILMDTVHAQNFTIL